MENEVVKKNSKKGLMLAIILTLIIALCLCYYFVFIRMANPKMVYEKVIDIVYLNAKSIYDDARIIDEDKSEVDYEISFKGKDNDMATVINNLKISGSYNSNLDTKEALSSVVINYKGGEALSLKAYLKDNSAFINIFGDNYFTESSSFDTVWDLANNKEMEKVADEIVSILKKNLDNKYFTSSRENGLKKYTLNLTKDYYKEYAKNIITDIQKSEVITKLMNDANTSDSVLKMILDNYIESLDNGEFINTKVDIILDKTNNVHDIKISAGDAEFGINKKDKNSFDVVVSSGGSKNKIGTITVEGNSYIIKTELGIINSEITLTHSKEKFDLTVNLSSSLNIGLTSKYTNQKDKGSITISYNANSVEVFAMNMNYTVKKNTEINAGKFDNPKNIDNLTEEYLYEKFSQNEYLKQLLEDLDLYPYDNQYSSSSYDSSLYSTGDFYTNVKLIADASSQAIQLSKMDALDLRAGNPSSGGVYCFTIDELGGYGLFDFSPVDSLTYWGTVRAVPQTTGDYLYTLSITDNEQYYDGYLKDLLESSIKEYKKGVTNITTICP